MIGKLDQLTGLRYFAALLVFLSHFKWKELNNGLSKVFNSGYVGVSFFFVLSGFVLSYSYGDKISNHFLSAKKYFLLRLARLTPLHLLTALPFIIYEIYKSDFHILKILINILFLQSWIPNSSYYFSLNAPSWSLSNEMFFYALFFTLIFLSTKKLIKTLIILLATIVFSASVVEFLFSDTYLWGENSISHWLFYIFPIFRLLEFIIGMLLFKVWQNNHRIPKWMVLPSYFFLFLSMYFADYIPVSFRMSLFFIPSITLFFFAHLTENTLAYRIFKSKLIVYLGNVSFAFYLIHQPMLDIIMRLTNKYTLTNASYFLVSLISISIMAIFIYESYERKVEFFLKNIIVIKVK